MMSEAALQNLHETEVPFKQHHDPNPEEAMRHFFVINPRSFPSITPIEKVLADIEKAFTELRALARTGEHETHLSRFPRDAFSAVRRFHSRAPETPLRVYAVGGDGILFDCLNAVKTIPGTQLAGIPYGAANDFIRAFGESACDEFRDLYKQIAGGTIKTDIIACNANFAMNGCSIGLESAAIRKAHGMANRLRKLRYFKRHRGQVYTMGALLALLDGHTRFQEYEIEIDGEDYSGNYCNIAVSNGPCSGGNRTPMPYATPDDGWLDVALAKSTSVLRTLAMMYRTGVGDIEQLGDMLLYRRFRCMTVHSKEAMAISMDGETFRAEHADIRICPAAIDFVHIDGRSYRPIKGRNENEISK